MELGGVMQEEEQKRAGFMGRSGVRAFWAKETIQEILRQK